MDFWTSIDIVCGALIALVVVASYVARGTRRVWHLMRKVNRLLDQTLGDPTAGKPSLMQRVQSIEQTQDTISQQLAEHLEWHADPKGQPARPTQQRPNGTGRQPPRR